MKYVKTGSIVLYANEKAQVIGDTRIQDRTFSVLELEDGRCVSVPFTSIIFNGSSFFVTSEGIRAAAAINAAEKVIQEIRDHMQVWDQENPNPRSLGREETVDGLFMEWLRGGSATHNNEALGTIVRYVIKHLESI